MPANHDDATPGSERVVARAPSALGGPDWAVRSYEGATGLKCVALGRTDGRRFGRAGDTGVEEVALDDSGVCADPVEAPLQVAVSYQPSVSSRSASSVLFGTVDQQRVRELSIRDPAGRTTKVQEGGGILAVAESVAPGGAWTVSVMYADGRSEGFVFESR